MNYELWSSIRNYYLINPRKTGLLERGGAQKRDGVCYSLHQSSIIIHHSFIKTPLIHKKNPLLLLLKGVPGGIKLTISRFFRFEEAAILRNMVRGWGLWDMKTFHAWCEKCGLVVYLRQSARLINAKSEPTWKLYFFWLVYVKAYALLKFVFWQSSHDFWLLSLLEHACSQKKGRFWLDFGSALTYNKRNLKKEVC